MEPVDPLARPLAVLSRRIAAGEVSGDAAFNAMVTLVSADLIPPGASHQLAAKIRDEVVLGLSSDRALCELIYAAPTRPGSAPESERQADAPPVDEPPLPAHRPAERGPDAKTIDDGPTASQSTPAGIAFTSASASGIAAVPGPGGAERGRALVEIDLPPEFTEPIEDDASFVGRQRRNRILAGVAVVAVVGGGAAIYATQRPGPCDQLARQVCFEMPDGDCVIARVRQSLADQGIHDNKCEETRIALAAAVDGVDTAKRPTVYGQALVKSLGFDPRPYGPDGELDPEPDEEPDAPQSVEVVGGQANITSLFADYAHLYWTVSDPPGIHSVRNIGGAPPATLSSSPNPIGVTPTRDFVYWLSRGEEGGLIWVDKKRGDHEPFSIPVADHNPALAVFMGGEFAFVDGASGAVVLYTVSTETKRVLAAGGTPVPGAIAADSTHVFWGVDAPVSAVMAAPREGAADAPPNPKVIGSGLGAVRALTADAEHLYFIDASTKSIARLPKAGGPTEVLAKSQAGPTDLAVDQTSVYWTNAEAGTVMRMPKAGGDAAAVVVGQTNPRFVALDKAAIYWESGGALLRRAK